jgi:hypothetical protein
VIDIADDRFTYRRNEEGIREESRLDGLYAVCASVPADVPSSEETVKAYKSLSSVERAFRSLKTLDIEIRPIYRYRSDRVKGHVLLCMSAYYVEWRMRQALAPILFDDHDREGAQAARASVVAPAKVSEAALAKVRARAADDGLPLHGFRTLLQDLAGLTKNEVRFRDVKRPVTMYANATEVQRRAFDLSGVNYRL